MLVIFLATAAETVMTVICNKILTHKTKHDSTSGHTEQSAPM